MPDIYMDVDTALSEVPVNLMPLIDDGDFKTRETGVAYNAGGMDLVWNFVTTDGSFTQTAVTPTTGGAYDWTHQGDGIYTIEIPASGGASINNDTEGFGWFVGVCDGVLPWRGPVIGFRAAAINNSLIDGATVDVNVTAMAAGVVTAAAIATGAIDADAIADNAIDAGAIASNAITSAKIATDAIGAAQIASDAITEIQSGLATASALATIDDFLDTEIAAILADTNELQTDWADGGRLDLILDARASQSSVNTIDDFLDTEIAAILSDTNAILADTGTDGVVVASGSKTGYALTSGEHTSIADALLKRDWTSVSGEASRSVLNALRFLRNKWSISGSTLTVTEEDDSTTAWTGALTTSSSADSVTGVDPS